MATLLRPPIPPVEIDNIRSQQDCIEMAASLINATQFTNGFTVNCDVRVTKEMEEALEKHSQILLCQDRAVQVCLPSEAPLDFSLRENEGLTTSSTMPGVVLMPQNNEPVRAIKLERE
jgi:hypothetical protein